MPQQADLKLLLEAVRPLFSICGATARLVKDKDLIAMPSSCALAGWMGVLPKARAAAPVRQRQRPSAGGADNGCG